MEKDFNISALIERLRTGEKIECLKCKNGLYITKQECIRTSHSFWCNNCGDSIHVTSAEYTVE